MPTKWPHDDNFWTSLMGVAFLKAQAWHEAGQRYPAATINLDKPNSLSPIYGICGGGASAGSSLQNGSLVLEEIQG